MAATLRLYSPGVGENTSTSSIIIAIWSTSVCKAVTIPLSSGGVGAAGSATPDGTRYGIEVGMCATTIDTFCKVIGDPTHKSAGSTVVVPHVRGLR